MISRRFLYLSLAALAVVGVALEYQSYWEQHRTIGLQTAVGTGGARVDDGSIAALMKPTGCRETNC